MVNTINSDLEVSKVSPREDTKTPYFDKKMAVIREIQLNIHENQALAFLAKRKFNWIASIPKELKFIIFDNLDSASLTSVALTNRTFHAFIHSNGKYKIQTVGNSEVKPLNEAIQSLEEKLKGFESLAPNIINEILKKIPFLLPYLAKSNQQLASKLLKKLNPRLLNSDEIAFFLLAGLANLKDLKHLMEALSKDLLQQVSQLMQVLKIVSSINPGQIPNLIEFIRDKQSTCIQKYDLSPYSNMHEEWVSRTNPKSNKKTLQITHSEEKEFDWMKEVPENLIEAYIENSKEFVAEFAQFVRLFHRMVKESSVESIKKLVEMSAQNQIFLIDFLVIVDPSFFKCHLEFFESIIKKINPNELSKNQQFEIIIFEIRFRLLKVFDLSKFTKYQRTMIKLELLKNDIKTIDSFVSENRDEYDFGVLLIAFKILSKIDLVFALKSVEVCKVSDAEKIHIRALLADIRRRKRFLYQEISWLFYVDSTLSNIEKRTCGYIE